MDVYTFIHIDFNQSEVGTCRQSEALTQNAYLFTFTFQKAVTVVPLTDLGAVCAILASNVSELRKIIYV